MVIIAVNRQDDSYSANSSVSSDSTGRLEAMQELKTLKELLDVGAITQEEYDSKKVPLMARI